MIRNLFGEIAPVTLGTAITCACACADRDGVYAVCDATYGNMD